MTVYLPDTAATEALAASLAARLPASVAGWSITLSGDLGAGKSTFARALIHAMGHEGRVPSPTYTLIEPYEIGARIVYHIDLYRVSDPSELHYLGWDELDNGLRLIEWPERAPALTAPADLVVVFRYCETGRKADWVGNSARGAALAEQLQADYDK